MGKSNETSAKTKEAWAVLDSDKITALSHHLHEPRKVTLTRCMELSGQGYTKLQKYVDEVKFDWIVEAQKPAWQLAQETPADENTLNSIMEEIGGVDRKKLQARKDAQIALSKAVKAEKAVQEAEHEFLDEVFGLNAERVRLTQLLNQYSRAYSVAVNHALDTQKLEQSATYQRKCNEFGGEKEYRRAILIEQTRRQNPELVTQLGKTKENLAIAESRLNEARQQLQEAIAKRVDAENAATAANAALDS